MIQGEYRRGIAEDIAVRLVIELTRSAIQFCLKQPDDAGVAIRPRIDRRRAEATVVDTESIGIEDVDIGSLQSSAMAGSSNILTMLGMK